MDEHTLTQVLGVVMARLKAQNNAGRAAAEFGLQKATVIALSGHVDLDRDRRSVMRDVFAVACERASAPVFNVADSAKAALRAAFGDEI